MAINDINIINSVESLQNITVTHEKKEKNKKEKKTSKSINRTKEEQIASEDNQQAKMGDNDRHLLDFKA